MSCSCLSVLLSLARCYHTSHKWDTERSVNLDQSMVKCMMFGYKLFITTSGSFGPVIMSGVNLRVAPKGLKAAPCSAKLTEEASGASFRTATKVLRAAPLFVKAMEVANVACLMEVGSAPKVCMEEPSIV